ncbi:MAG: hypothetical protein QM523_04695 [Candidatus Pacebacteria bacterium]|nr:hypothetical protein [Candidatus Paceibacterota bacterium]
MKNIKKFLAILSLPLMISACAQGDYRKAAVELQGHMATGNWQAAETLAVKNGKIDDKGKSKDLLWSLNHGLATIQTGKYKASIDSFDNAESLMKFDDLSGFMANAGSATASVLVNDTVRDYAFNSYDAIMVNSYKGLAFMLNGDQGNARVEFNRSAERQRRAVERFALEIKADQEKNAAGAKKNPKVNSNETVNKANDNAQVKATYAELESKAGYAPFVNPFTSYIRGVFLLSTAVTTGEFENAISDLRSVKEMVGGNSVIDADLKFATAKVEGKNSDKRVWVIFENGQSPILVENKIKSLMVMPTGLINFVYAYPSMKFQPLAYNSLNIAVDGREEKTLMVSDFDAVAAREFKDRLPGIITRAVLSSAYKTAIQVAGQAVAASAGKDNTNAQVFGLLMNIGGAIMSEATTAADVRSWLELPKQFQAASFTPPKSGEVVIKTDSGVELGKVTVPNDRNAVIYVKIQKTGATPVIKSVLF